MPLQPIVVPTVLPGVHLEVEPEQNSDRSWRFTVVLKFSDEGSTDISIIELGGWRVDSKYCEIMAPQFSIPKINRTFLLGKMSPDIKMGFLTVLKPAIENHIRVKEEARVARATKKGKDAIHV